MKDQHDPYTIDFLDQQNTCRSCHGWGSVASHDVLGEYVETCPECEGTGDTVYTECGEC